MVGFTWFVGVLLLCMYFCFCIWGLCCFRWFVITWVLVVLLDFSCWFGLLACRFVCIVVFTSLGCIVYVIIAMILCDLVLLVFGLVGFVGCFLLVWFMGCLFVDFVGGCFRLDWLFDCLLFYTVVDVVLLLCILLVVLLWFGCMCLRFVELVLPVCLQWMMCFAHLVWFCVLHVLWWVCCLSILSCVFWWLVLVL